MAAPDLNQDNIEDILSGIPEVEENKNVDLSEYEQVRDLTPEEEQQIDNAARLKEIEQNKENLSLEDQITNAIDTINIHAESEKISLEEVEALFILVNLLPPSESTTRTITRRLVQLFNKLVNQEPRIYMAFDSALQDFLAANPSLGFMIITAAITDGFEYKLESTVKNDVIVGFLSRINENSVPLEQGIRTTVAEILLDLLTDSHTSDQITQIVLNLYNNPYFSQFEFNSAYNTEKRQDILRVLIDKYKDNTEMSSQLRSIVERFYPEEYPEIYKEDLEKEKGLVTIIDILEDQSITPEEKVAPLIDLINILDEESSKENADEAVLRRLYTTIFNCTRRLVLLDEYTYQEGGYGDLVLQLVFKLKENSLDDTRIEAKLLPPQLPLWMVLQQRFEETLNVLSTQRANYEGISQFYLMFIEDISKCTLVSEDFEQRLIENLFTALPNEVAITLISKFYENQPALELDQFDPLSIESIDQVKSQAEVLKAHPLGRFMLWVIDLDKATVTNYLIQLEDRSPIYDLISIVRPDIREGLEDEKVEYRLEKSNRAATIITTAYEAITLEINEEEIRKEQLAKYEKQRNWRQRFAQTVEVKFGSKRFRKAWEDSINESLEKDVQQKKLRQKARDISTSVDALIEIMRVRDGESSSTFLMALSNNQVRENFVDSLRGLKSILANPNHPLRDLLAGKLGRITHLFDSFALEPDILVLLPKDVISVNLNRFSGMIEVFNGRLGGYRQEKQRVEEISSGFFASIGRRINREPSKNQEERALSSLYESMNFDRTAVIEKVLAMLRNQRLREVYGDLTVFEDLLVDLYSSMEASGINTFIEETLFSEYLWVDLPERAKFAQTSILLKGFIKGDEKMKRLLLKQISNQNPPPRFVRSELSDYMSGIYIYIQQVDTPVRTQVNTLLHEEPVERSLKDRLLRRPPNPRNMFLSEIDELDEFLQGGEALQRTEVLNMLNQIRKLKGAEAELGNQQQSVDSFEQELTSIDIINSFKPEIFTRQPQEAIDGINKAIEIFKKVKNQKQIINNIIYSLENNSEQITVIVKKLLSLYYLTLYYKKESGKDDAALIMEFIQSIINRAIASNNMEAAKDLIELSDQFYRSNVRLIPDFQTEIDASESKLMTGAGTAEMLKREQRFKELVNEFNTHEQFDAFFDRKILLSILTQINGLTTDLDSNLISQLVGSFNTPDGIKTLQGFVRSLYVFIYKFQRYEYAQKEAELLFNTIIDALPEDIKNDVLANLEPEVNTRLDKLKRRTGYGFDARVRNTANKYFNGRVQRMNERINVNINIAA